MPAQQVLKQIILRTETMGALDKIKISYLKLFKAKTTILSLWVNKIHRPDILSCPWLYLQHEAVNNVTILTS